MADHDDSGPPSPPPFLPDETGRHTALPSNPSLASNPMIGVGGRPAETDTQRSLRISLEARALVKREVGSPPVPAKKDPGSGLWAALVDFQTATEARFSSLSAEISATHDMCVKILSRLDAADAASAKKTSWAARIGWIAIAWLVPVILGALLYWLSGFHRSGEGAQPPDQLQGRGTESRSLTR